MSHTINILAGPTAVGKTALALDWAAANDAEIVNADALLFYRGMTIGTAKPNAEEQARVPHHLIDIRPVREVYSIKEYVRDVQSALDDVFARGKQVLVVGGSGFYLKCYFAPVADDIQPDPAIRANVQRLERDAGLRGMLGQLDALNPGGTGKLDRDNPRRVSRALERCLISGQNLAELEAQFIAKPGPFDQYAKRSALLLRSNEELHPRVEARTQAMLEAGLIDEVRHLQATGLEENPTAASSIGYRETLGWLAHNDAATPLAPAQKATTLNQAELAEAINLSTRRLIAKQRKWFRTQFSPDQVLDGDARAEDLFRASTK